MCAQKNTILSPKEAVIAIDLHGVLFIFDSIKLTLLIGSISLISAALFIYINPLTALIFFIITSTPAFFITIASSYFAIRNGYRPIVEYHILASPKPPIPLFKKLWLWISNFFYPRKKLVDFCWQLKNSGYHLILLSDIGPEAFSILKKRYPHTFFRNNTQLFSETFYPNSPDSNSIAITPWFPKNAHNFFKKFSRAFIRHNPGVKKIVFIDNNKKNIRRAKEQDYLTYKALKFNSTKQLQQALKQIVLF